MGRDVQWRSDAWDEYCKLQQTDRAIARKINELIKAAQRDPFGGCGKPEPLNQNLSGMWSRRINDTDRLIYCLKDGVLTIVSCTGHYES